MCRRLAVCVMRLLTRNVVYLSLIHFHLIAHFCQSSALSITKTLQTKCSLSSLSSFAYDWQLNRVSDQLAREVTQNNSVSDHLSHDLSDPLGWRRRKRHSPVPEYMVALYRSHVGANRLKHSAKVITSVTNSGEALALIVCHFPPTILPTN